MRSEWNSDEVLEGDRETMKQGLRNAAMTDATPRLQKFIRAFGLDYAVDKLENIIWERCGDEKTGRVRITRDKFVSIIFEVETGLSKKD